MTTWTNVPDPRDDATPCAGPCAVEVEEHRWRHITEEHVANVREPWDEWLTPTLADGLRAAWAPGSTEEGRRACIARVAEVVERDLRRCLTAPLAVLYDDFQMSAASRPSRGQETWALVLPSGAMLVVRSRPAGGAVVSCYFKGAACRATDPADRWRRTAEYVLMTYAKLNQDGTFSAPDRTEFVQGKAGLRIRIRFRTAATWALDAAGRRPWDVLPDDWGAGGAGDPTTTLRPRRTY
ncbi:hypothetical protein R5W23_004168 [Gemmata sp. JC673]|uniref:Uncharacterized protein n=1 Tax=Gemmata algarum TaxID=2975278 RepID=A0ABU5F527_9BACT|nr:hypothetical protein [Gemmata algarum]MDY3562690.1 hypothetical protein [Gemmata algarum]